MLRHDSSVNPRSSRRPSALSELLLRQKLDDARSLSPEERLRVAVALSDVCLELHRACLNKP